MPFYSYSTEDRSHTVSKFFRMGKQPTTITTDDGVKLFRDIVAEHCNFRNTPGNYPMKSEALGVNLSQIPEATENWKRAGINVTFDEKTGEMNLESHRQRKEVMKRMDMYDKSGWY